jgi:hypothetical protein
MSVEIPPPVMKLMMIDKYSSMAALNYLMIKPEMRFLTGKL